CLAGIAMLNNPFLGGVLIIFAIEQVRSTPASTGRAILRTAAAGMVSLLVFAASREFMSLWDDQFSMTRLISQFLFFDTRNTEYLASTGRPATFQPVALIASLGNWFGT